jgi:hypothetical protein
MNCESKTIVLTFLQCLTAKGIAVPVSSFEV